MAPRNGSESQNESGREERERLQAEAVDAWIVQDDAQKAAQAQIDALDAQAPLTTEQNDARMVNADKIAKALREKALIEYNYVHVLKCPIARLFADIQKKIDDRRAQEAVDRANSGPEGTGAAREQIQDLKASTYMDAAEKLLEAHLLPQDLRSGNAQKRAAMLVRPDLAKELPSPSAQADLEAYADQVQPVFDRLELGYEAARDMEKGVVVGKAGETISEAIRNPSRLGHAFVALAGAGMLLYAVKDLFGGASVDSPFKKFLLGAVGLGALGYGGFETVKGLDLLNTATNIRSDALLASDAMKTVRADVQARMGTKDSAQVDDMIRTFDSPIENYADAYLSALRTHSSGIELARLGGHGLSDKEMSYANKEAIKKNGDWLFMELYDAGLADGKITAQTNDDAKRAAGAEYAKTEFKGLNVGTIVLARDMVAAGINTAPESSVTDPHLRELVNKDAAFREVLKPTGQAGIYTIKGAPVRFNYTDLGDYEFTNLLNNNALTKVSGKLDGDALSSTLAKVTDEATKAIGDALKLEFASVSGSLQYKEGSPYWETVPPLSRTMPAGLPTYESSRKVNTLFYYDVKDKVLRAGLDFNNDGVVDPHEPPFTTIAEVQHEYERKLFEVRVPQDISSTMLVPYKITDWNDAGTTSEVSIQYGTATGKLVYSGDKLTSYTLGADATLEARWTEGAQAKQAEFLGDPRVQAALLRATTSYTGYDESLISGLVAKFVGMGKDVVEWVKNDSVANKFANEWEEQVIRKMTEIMYNPVTGFNKTYVDNIYKRSYANDVFQAQEDVFMNAQIASLEGAGVLMAKVVPLKGPDMDIEWTDLPGLINERGRGPIEAALSPLKYEKPTPSSSTSWEIVNGVINFVKQDAVRNEEYEKILKRHMDALNTAVYAIPSTAGHGSKVSQHELEAEIEKACIAAQKEALGYWGLDNPDAVEKMLLSPLTGQPGEAEWTPATKKVASYMTNNMKWESYGILPNAENFGEIMEMWYAKIDNAKTKPASPADADKYADYFMWEVYLRMGGSPDWSPDRFNGGETISSVSDTRFDANITKLQTIPDFALWSTSFKLIPVPPPAGMESDFNKYKDLRTAEMDRWFADHNDVKVWERFHRYGPDMCKWRDTYIDSYNNRMKDIQSRYKDTSPTAVNDYYQATEEFKQFLLIEQKVYETFITAGVVPETDYVGIAMPFSAFVSVEVTKRWAKYFYQTPRDLAGYNAEITKNLADAIDAGWPIPNMPGIPFWS